MTKKVLALVDGIMTEVGLIGCPVKFVVLTAPNGDPVAVNPRAVVQVRRINANRSRLLMRLSPNVIVQGDVASVVAALEA